MEPTAVGANRTGATLAPKQVEQMLDAVSELSPLMPINLLPLDMERQSHINEAESVGSIPQPQGKRGRQPEVMALLLDKLGERIAFERTGTRLYDALITKYLALTNQEAAGTSQYGQEEARPYGVATLREIRAQELNHFLLLSKCVQKLGGDPTAQTPCADVTATASIGLMQVITDPRTTLAQCLNTILTAELTDNAGWEMLSELATQAGQPEMAEQFAAALETEAEHLVTIRSWLQSLLARAAGSAAV